MRRLIFKVPEIRPGEVVTLPADEAHHARDVLRLKTGADVLLSDGGGALWRGTLAMVSGQAVTVQLAEAAEPVDMPMPVTAAVALVKKGFDTMVRQATELGIQTLVPLITARTVKGLAPKHKRWEAISRAAEKQAGRGSPLTVPDAMPLSELLASPEFMTPQDGLNPSPVKGTQGLFFGDPGASCTLLEAALAASPPFVVAIGPEGGFSQQEKEKLLQSGFRPVDLGPYVLRTDTAFVKACSVLIDVIQGQGPKVAKLVQPKE